MTRIARLTGKADELDAISKLPTGKTVLTFKRRRECSRDFVLGSLETHAACRRELVRVCNLVDVGDGRSDYLYAIQLALATLKGKP
jgi:hypothetical protein